MPNPNIDTLVTEVSETKTVQDSAIALLNGLKTRLDTAITELAALGIDNATLNQLSTDLDTSTNALADAVSANTPAE
jgi:hypothetical protein